MYYCVKDVELGEVGGRIGQIESSRTCGSGHMHGEIVETSWQYAEWTPMFLPNHEDERNFYMSEYDLWKDNDYDGKVGKAEEVVEDNGFEILSETEGRYNLDVRDSGKNDSLTNGSDDQVSAVTNLVMDTRVCGLGMKNGAAASDLDDNNNKWTTWKRICGKVGGSLPFHGSTHLSLLSFCFESVKVES